MELDFGKVLRFTFIDWIKEKTILKYAAFLFVFYFLINLISSYVMNALFSNIDLTNATVQATSLLYFFGYLIVMVPISAIFVSIATYFITAKALELKKMNFVEFSAERLVRLIILSIAEVFASMFSIFKLKLLLIPVAGIFSIIGGLVFVMVGAAGTPILALIGILLIILGLLLGLTYLVVIMYNSFRFCLSSVAFVREELSIKQSLRASWETTRGNVINVFVVMLILGVAIWTVSSIVSIPLTGYFMISGITSVTGTEGVSKIAELARTSSVLLNPIVILLSVPTILINSLAVILQVFGLVGVYVELKNNMKHPVVTQEKNAVLQPTKARVVTKKIVKKAKRK